VYRIRTTVFNLGVDVFKLPVRQLTTKEAEQHRCNFSKLPVRQLTLLLFRAALTRFSKLPVRQLT